MQSMHSTNSNCSTNPTRTWKNSTRTNRYPRWNPRPFPRSRRSRHYPRPAIHCRRRRRPAPPPRRSNLRRNVATPATSNPGREEVRRFSRLSIVHGTTPEPREKFPLRSFIHYTKFFLWCTIDMSAIIRRIRRPRLEKSHPRAGSRGWRTARTCETPVGFPQIRFSV